MRTHKERHQAALQTQAERRLQAWGKASGQEAGRGKTRGVHAQNRPEERPDMSNAFRQEAQGSVKAPKQTAVLSPEATPSPDEHMRG